MRSIIKEIGLSFNEKDNFKKQNKLEEEVIKEGLEFALGRQVEMEDGNDCQRVYLRGENGAVSDNYVLIYKGKKVGDVSFTRIRGSVICELLFHEQISNITYDSRRTGKTTRLVNDAIEKLFETGDIYIPMIFSYDSHPEIVKRLECTPDQIFVDVDAQRINFEIVQEYLYKRIISRLELEHAGQIGRGNVGPVRAICLRESGKAKPATERFRR